MEQTAVSNRDQDQSPQYFDVAFPPAPGHVGPSTSPRSLSPALYRGGSTRPRLLHRPDPAPLRGSPAAASRPRSGSGATPPCTGTPGGSASRRPRRDAPGRLTEVG